MFYSVSHWNSHVQISYVLVPILSHLTVDEFSVHDSFSFVTKISEEYCLDHFVASLNVNNLFPNIYLGKAIDIWINELFFKRDTIQNLDRNPANICLYEDILETFSRGLSSSPSEGVFKKSWSRRIYSSYTQVFRRRPLDVLIKTDIFTLVINLQDVLQKSL